MDERCDEHSAHARAIRVHDERMAKHGEEIDAMRECIARLTALQEGYARWQAEADDRIAALESKPARQWETAVTAVVTAVVGAIVGFAMASLGM